MCVLVVLGVVVVGRCSGGRRGFGVGDLSSGGTEQVAALVGALCGQVPQSVGNGSRYGAGMDNEEEWMTRREWMTRPE